MDYSTGEVHIFDLPLSYQKDPENFMVTQCSQDGMTFKEGNCDYMVVDLKNNEGRLPLYIH